MRLSYELLMHRRNWLDRIPASPKRTNHDQEACRKDRGCNRCGCWNMFARQGAKVIGIDIEEDAVTSTSKEIETAGHSMIALSGFDLTNEAQTHAATRAIQARTDQVDVLLNAAAFGVFEWIEDLTFEDWNKTLAGELSIVFLLTKALWPVMKTSGATSIINFASVNAYNTLEGSAAIAHCAGKGGVLAMTRLYRNRSNRPTHNGRARTQRKSTIQKHDQAPRQAGRCCLACHLSCLRRSDLRDRGRFLNRCWRDCLVIKGKAFTGGDDDQQSLHV